MVKRILWIDNLSGLLILQLIFLCHVRILASSIPNTNFLYDIQYFLVFFMPWFFYKSGMFFKEKSFGEELSQSARKLLIPFGIYSVIGYGMQVGCMVARHESLSLQTLLYSQMDGLERYASIPWQQPLWFLITLFMVKNIYIVIQEKVANYLILTISFILAIVFSQQSPFLNFWIGTTFQSLFFYALGYLFRNCQYNKYIFGLAVVLYILRYVFGMVHDWDARINQVGSEDSYLLVIVILLSGIVLFNNIFRKYLDCKIPLLTFVGKKSMFFGASA